MSESAAGAGSLCPQCGSSFRCGMEAGDETCWCASLPALLPLPALSASGSTAASCLCPSCLQARLSDAKKT